MFWTLSRGMGRTQRWRLGGGGRITVFGILVTAIMIVVLYTLITGHNPS